MLNGITINKGQGGLGRPLEGTDYISGLLFYSASLPSGFSSNDRIKIVYSVEEGEALGILDTHVGETAAVAKNVISGTPAAGNTIKITYTGIEGLETVLSTYTLTSADAVSTTTAAAAIAAAINAGTVNHGFSATNSTNSLLVTTKGGEGVFPNTGTPYASTETGAGLTSTWTQPTGSGSTVLGIASDIDILHYHVSEFFRLQPKGKLYVGVYATADVGTFASVTLMQNFAQGAIKQMGVYYKSTSFVTSACTALQAQCTALEAVHKPLVTILGGEISGTTNVSSITADLHLLTAPQVSVTIGQDGANLGNHIFKAHGKSVTNVGEMLGAVALASVSDSIAWFGKFQVAATELDTLAFANGELYTTVSDSTITGIDNLGYCFLRKVMDLGGSYHNRPYTCVALTNDYCFIHSNRTIYKAIKNIRTTVLPRVASPIKVLADGTLSPDVINYFKGLGAQGLDVLLRNNEISNYAVIIDPSQDVLSTGILEITAQIQPIGVADFITINIGFVTSITS